MASFITTIHNKTRTRTNILLLLFLLLQHHFTGMSMAQTNKHLTKIAAIIDVHSRFGKQQITAMKIAVQNYNKISTRHNISLVVPQEYSENPLQVANTAEKLIREQQIDAVIGMTTWSEAALIADVGNRMKVPILSLVADHSPHNNEWPYLVQMVNNGSQQLKFAATIVQYCNWHRVVLIYEEDIYGGDSGAFSRVSQELSRIGSVIDYTLAFPSFSSISEQYIDEEMEKLKGVQSRAFLVLRLSFELTGVLFSKAKSMGFMEQDSAWLVSDSVAHFLEYANHSMISSMEGVIGIRTDYSRDTQPFMNFNDQFQRYFRTEYPGEAEMIPGIHALRAYDSVTVITETLKKIDNQSLLQGILSSNFTGLSGQILFKDGRLLDELKYEMVNVNETKINRLGYHNMTKLDGISWPGKLERIPKGWAMPTKGKPLIIGVPGKASFGNFVKITPNGNGNGNGNSMEKNFDGFCIRVFREVVRRLYDTKSYIIPVEFREFNGTYDDLVDSLADNTYDGIVGDLTISTKRWNKVEFTEPFTESGLVTVVPVRPANDEGWIFLKPFKPDLWLATGCMLLYTMFMVWFMEHKSNPDFSGSRREQLGNSLWFAFSSLFMAHREKIQSNYTRIVVVVWLFVGLLLTQSFTANLSAMLTVPRLISKDVTSLMRSNAKVGYDNNTLIKNFLTTLDYKPENMVNLQTEEEYLNAFEKGEIEAAIFEIPYAKVFVNNYCNKFTITGSSYRFGGLGFAFEKGSPLARDVSEAILAISENGDLKRLEKEWLITSECSLDQSPEVGGLSLKDFWGLFVFSGGVSTVSLLISVALKLWKYQRERERSLLVIGAMQILFL
ncbi:glutamate receptor 2.7-like isoform X2 [Impatiens glandulifera]|uniref:glutamate receptor 2.7-like isoform X2 n=1 Tax=Impatiens glandulifera TaxID=253017 RepID=UPI001FB19611|nr:glutamate receptor 2.7-like isoform X2 [Impatiens glandulifera]